MSQTRTATMTVVLTFDGPDATRKRIEDRLNAIVTEAYGEGLFTGETDMTVDINKVEITVGRTSEEEAASDAIFKELMADADED